MRDARPVKESKREVTLPIGHAARLAFEIDAVRAACCGAAQVLLSKSRFDEMELEECARLDDALAHAQRILKASVRTIMLSRIKRRSRRSRVR